MKIEPAMRLMKIPHYQPWRPKLWFDRERKLRICLCFLKVPVGWGINRRQVLICKLRTQILLVQRTSIQVILVVRTMFWSSRTTRRLRIWIPALFCVSHEHLVNLQGLFVSPEDDFWHFQLAFLVALDFLTVLPLFSPVDFESFEGFGLKWLHSLQNLRWLQPQVTIAGVHCLLQLLESYSAISAEGGLGWTCGRSLLLCCLVEPLTPVVLPVKAYQENEKTSPSPLIWRKQEIFMSENPCFRTVKTISQTSFLEIMISTSDKLHFCQP